MTAASSLDAAVLTAKVGVAAVAAKAAYDYVAGIPEHLSRLLEVAGALAAVYLVVKFGLRAALASKNGSVAAGGSAGAGSGAGSGPVAAQSGEPAALSTAGLGVEGEKEARGLVTAGQGEWVGG